ncbi:MULTISPECIES: hypothetical protein [Alcanivorax]|uniref:hypothetical protein n=1 Tax=Alcanivorax TaxID=59753 RepID=UPI0025BD0B77|nr:MULTISPECIES: hypothetical protein [Alcanivorax]
MDYNLAGSILWRIFGKLPGWFIAWYFNDERLANLIRIQPVPVSSSTRVGLHEHPTCEVSLQIINFSPFKVTLKDMELYYVNHWARVLLPFNRTVDLKSGDFTQMHISGDIPEGKADSIARSVDDHRSELVLNCEFNCKVRHFRKGPIVIHAVPTEIFNYQNRRDHLLRLEKEAAEAKEKAQEESAQQNQA